MRIVAGVLLLCVAGCSVPDLSEASFVQGLRVLVVQAEPPEALPGDAVTLTAFAVDTRGNAIDHTWSYCTLPSNGIANNGCTDGSGNGIVGIGSGATLAFTMPALDPASFGAPDATNGVYLPIILHTSAGGDTIDTIYRLRARVPEFIPPGCTLRAPYDPHCGPNVNPSISEIDPLADDTLTTDTHKDQFWSLLPHAGAAEEYAIPGSSMPTVFERLTVQWFATAGSFPDTPVGGTAVQKWTLDRALPPSGGAIDLWAVVHDERGGTGITHRGFTFR